MEPVAASRFNAISESPQPPIVGMANRSNAAPSALRMLSPPICKAYKSCSLAYASFVYGVHLLSANQRREMTRGHPLAQSAEPAESLIRTSCNDSHPCHTIDKGRDLSMSHRIGTFHVLASTRTVGPDSGSPA